MHESPGYSVVIVFVLEWQGISYLEKRRGIVGAMSFQKGKEARGASHDHGQTVAITTARGGPHGLAVAASPYCASPVLWATDTTGGPW